MKERVSIICPYCGHENGTMVDIQKNNGGYTDTMYCDNESGGCDKMFIYRITAKAVFIVETDKIKWENEMALDGVTEALRRGW